MKKFFRNGIRNKAFVKSFAIFSIYLIISITIFTAKAMAVLNYNVAGDNNADGYARADNDIIALTTTSDGNVSFVTGVGTANYKETPLTGCVNNNGVVTCHYNFNPTIITAKTIPFTLKQQFGTPLTKNGIVSIDSSKPVKNSFIVLKNGTGLLFKYNFTDYLHDAAEGPCLGSGIGYIEINVQGRPLLTKDIITKNCTVVGSFYADFSGNKFDAISYYAIVRDRVGNEYIGETGNISGDFDAPAILDFEIMNSGKEITDISGSANTAADLIVHLADSDMDYGTVYGDLSSLNINPAVSIPYKNIKASCKETSDGIYECTFRNVQLKPPSGNINITITATDSDGNIGSKTLTKVLNIRSNPGSVLYIGPLKEHCTQDLTMCYLGSGFNIIRTEISPDSSYEKSLVNVGINSAKTFSICRLNETWLCNGVYNVPKGTTTLSLFVADSQDDYGNKIKSDLKRSVYIDDEAPILVGNYSVSNSNHNGNCSVSGDELTLHFNITESVSPELRIYVNTSAFTTRDKQYAQCVKKDNARNGNYECTLTITDFSSVPNILEQNIIVEDLAGKKLVIPYTFRVCKGSSDNPPNVIHGLIQNGKPNIDRRTASILPIKTYIPVTLEVSNGAKILYASIDRCTSPGINGMDIMSSGNYFIPTYGSDLTMVLNIGHQDAQLSEGSMQINCTVSMRINVGETVYTKDEVKSYNLTINTYNQPLGSLDATTEKSIDNTKKQLRDLDKDLKKYKDITSILKTICDISNVLIKIDSILQALKSVLYVICLVLQGYPVTTALAHSLWEAFNAIFSTFDGIVQKYIWPTGSEGNPIGYIWKYTCIIYNCRFYTLSGLMEIVSDIGSAIHKNDATTPDKNSQASTTTTKDKDGNEVTTTQQKYADGSTHTTETTTKNGGIDYSDGEPTGYKTETIKTETIEYGGGDLTTTTTYPDGSSVTTTINSYDSGGNYKEIVEKGSDGKTINSVTKKYESAGGGTSSENLQNNGDGTYTLIGNDGTKQIVQIDNPGTQSSGLGLGNLLGGLGGKGAATPQPTTPYYNTQDSNSIPVDGAIQNTYPSKFLETAAKQDKLSTGQQGVLYSEIERHDWIINPYKSTYYDGLCIPATVYNIQKERQIKCMYLSCLESSRNSGMSVGVCNDIYNVNNCLYLESAQHRLNSNLFAQISKGLVQQSVMYAMGYIVQEVYGAVCEEYIESYGEGELNSDGWHSVGCGLFGASLKFQEVLALLKSPSDVMKNLMHGSGVDDPAKLHDYCNGGQLYAE